MSRQNEPDQESIDEVVSDAREGHVPRRDFLRRVVALGLSSAAAYKLLDATKAGAQYPSGIRMTTMALGEEGNPIKATDRSNRSNSPLRADSRVGKATTFAVGEESSKPPVQSQPTTFAVGEESAPQPTTMAVGEESSSRPTTLAVGEESAPPSPPATGPPVTSQCVGEESTVTTHAVGEESTWKPGPPANPPKATTFAVGEESGSQSPRTPSVTTRAVGEEQGNGRAFPSIRPRQITPWKNFRRW